MSVITQINILIVTLKSKSAEWTTLMQYVIFQSWASIVIILTSSYKTSIGFCN